MSKILFAIYLLLISFSAFSQEECIFDENAYSEFINEYAENHANAVLQPDDLSLVVTIANVEILVEGGGCTHLGMTIQVKSSLTYDEAQFLQHVSDVSTEFGAWLLNIDELYEAIEERKWIRVYESYYFHLNEMTVFEASINDHGITVNFYIN